MAAPRILETLGLAISECGSDRLVVAFSGGLDSSVLLHGLVSLDMPFELRAIHVNHGLHPDAAEWEAHCEATCRAWHVPLDVARLALTAGPSDEQRAREARYEAFAEHTLVGDCLLLAHHLDDQVETILLRLLRGAGSAGIAGMPRRRPLGQGELLRPLLELPRSALEGYAHDAGLAWVDDPSNESERFDRNYLRHRVLPVLAARWPGYRRVMARSSELMEDTAAIMREIADGDMRTRLGGEGTLCIGDLQRLSELRQLNLLHGWLASNGIRTPSRRRLRELARQCESGEDRMPCIRFGDVEIRRYRNALHVVRSYTANHEARLEWCPPQPARWCGGTLWAEPTTGGGLARAGFARLVVRARSGGERVRAAGRPTKPVKKLLQEAHVPPWLRFRLPLLHVGDELVAAPGVFIGEGWQAQAVEPGWEIRWRPD